MYTYVYTYLSSRKIYFLLLIHFYYFHISNMTCFFQKYTLYRHSTQHLINMLYHLVFCVTIIILCFHIYIYNSQYMCVLSLKILPMPYFLHPNLCICNICYSSTFYVRKIYAKTSVFLFALKIYILHVTVLNMIVFKCSYSNCDY